MAITETAKLSELFGESETSEGIGTDHLLGWPAENSGPQRIPEQTNKNAVQETVKSLTRKNFTIVTSKNSAS